MRKRKLFEVEHDNRWEGGYFYIGFKTTKSSIINK